MDKLERLLILREIDDLAIHYWDEVDRNRGANAHNLFTEDCTLATSQKVRKGRAAVKEFYDSRVARGDRIARHMIGNHKITIHDRDTVSTVWVLMHYAADGQWRYRSRLTTPLFKDFDTATTG